MRLTDNLHTSAAWGWGQTLPFQEEQTETSGSAAVFEKPAVLLDFSFGLPDRDAKTNAYGIDNAIAKQNSNNNGVEDSSGRLTKMLVSARSREEVQETISQAYKNLGEVMQAAAAGDESAQNIVRRLNRLIRRANRKMRDLTKEADVKQKQKRAEKQELEQLSRQLEDELKRKIEERKQREKKYLRDAHPHDNKNQSPTLDFSVAALTARLRMLEFAHKMAHSSTSSAVFHAEATGSISTAGENTVTEDEIAD